MMLSEQTSMVIGQYSRTRGSAEDVKQDTREFIAPNSTFAFALPAKEIAF